MLLWGLSLRRFSHLPWTLDLVAMRVRAAEKALKAGFIDRIAPSQREVTVQILIAFLLALLLICIVAIVVAAIMAMTAQPPDIAALKALFVEAERAEVRPEPIERAAYLSAILTTLPATFVAIFAARRIVVSRASATATVTSSMLILAVLMTAVFINSDLVTYVLGGQLSGRFAAEVDPRHILSVATAVAAAAFLVHRTINRTSTRALPGKAPSRAIYAALALIVVLTVVAGRIRSASMIYGDPHFEAVFYSMSQVMAGKTLLADLPSQYGLYAELLRPLFSVIGSSVLKFTIVMTLLQAVGCLALLRVCVGLLRPVWLQAVAVLTLSLFVGSTWVAISDSPFGHEYYQLWPIRFFFPAVSLLLFVEGLRRGLPPRWVTWMALLAGLAIIWNLESGIAVLGALVGSMLIRFLVGGAARRGRNAGALLLSMILPIAELGGFLLILYFKSSGALHPLDWIKYQTIFYSTGFGMLPMPRYPHPWMAVLGLYLFGIVGAVWTRAAGQRSFDWDAMFYLAIMGLGLFTYYQGRSHDVVLTFVVWPAVLIAFMLADRILRAAADGSLPKLTAWSAAPVLVFGVLMSLRCLAGLPGLVGTTFTEVRTVNAGRSAALDEAIAFIKSKAGRDNTAVILDRGQSVLFAETGLASTEPGPGMVETLLKEDEDRFVNRLLASPVRHIFVRLAADGSIPSPYSALLSAYQVVDSGQGMQHLTPSKATFAR
jgi:hypothetical protein